MMQQLCSSGSFCRAVRLVVASTLLALVSCGDGRTYRKVYPVKGKILVNGQPAEDCHIVLNHTYEDKNPVAPQARTDAKGEFQLTTYQANDGAPDGEYIATITWRERSGITKQEFEGPDRLGGAYAKAEKNKGLPGFVIKVENKALELPPFDLKQSAEAKRKLEEAKRRKPTFGGPLGSSDP